MSTKSLFRWAPLAVLLAAPLAFGDNDPNQPKDNNKNMPSDTSKSDTSKSDKTSGAMKLADSDVQLLAHLHQMDQTEIELGQIAQNQAQSKAVKSYAKQIVDDHKANDRELQTFARKHNVKIPKASGMSDAEQKEMKDEKDMIDRLKSMKGADFDREYLLVMVADHDRAVASLEAEAQKAQNSDLQQMIKDMKPVLQRHADMARDLQKTVAQPGAPQSSPGAQTPSPSDKDQSKDQKDQMKDQNKQMPSQPQSY